MSAWLLVAALAFACIVLALRLAAEVWYSRELRQLVTDMIEEELPVGGSDDATVRGLVRYSAERAEKEAGVLVSRGGQS